MTVGRPTEYTPELIAKAREYLATCEDEEVKVVTGTSQNGGEFFKHKLNVKIPSKGGLAIALGVSRETLYAWAKEYPEFSDIMDAMGAKQEAALIGKGLSGDYNSTIAKVLLTKHGYRDAVDSDLTSKGKALPIYGGLSVQTDNSNEQNIQTEQEN